MLFFLLFQERIQLFHEIEFLIKDLIMNQKTKKNVQLGYLLKIKKQT